MSGIRIEFDKSKAIKDLENLLNELQNITDKTKIKSQTDILPQLEKLLPVAERLKTLLNDSNGRTFIGKAQEDTDKVYSSFQKLMNGVQSLEEAMKKLSKVGNITSLTKNINPSTREIEGFTVQVQKATGQIEKLKFAFSGLSEDKMTRLFKMDNAQIIDGKQISILEKYQQKLIDIKKSLQGVGSTSNLGLLKEIDTAINIINSSISRLNDGKELKFTSLETMGSLVDKVGQKHKNILEIQKQINNEQKELVRESQMEEKDIQSKVAYLEKYLQKVKEIRDAYSKDIKITPVGSQYKAITAEINEITEALKKLKSQENVKIDLDSKTRALQNFKNEYSNVLARDKDTLREGEQIRQKIINNYKELLTLRNELARVDKKDQENYYNYLESKIKSAEARYNVEYGNYNKTKYGHKRELDSGLLSTEKDVISSYARLDALNLDKQKQRELNDLVVQCNSEYSKLNDLINKQYSIKEKLIKAEGEEKRILERNLQLVENELKEQSKHISGEGLENLYKKSQIIDTVIERQRKLNDLTAIHNEQQNKQRSSEQEVARLKQSEKLYAELSKYEREIFEIKRQMISADQASMQVLREKLTIAERERDVRREQINNNNNLGNIEKESQLTKQLTDQKRLLNAETQKHNIKMQESSKHVKTWGNSFKNALSTIILYSTSGGLLFGLLDQIRQGVTFMKELDTSQSNIMMITGKTREEVQGLTKDYANLSSQMHETTSNMMKGAEEFLRAGYTDKETLSLLKSSTLASKISGTDQKTVSDDLIAIKNAFKMQVDGFDGVSGAVDKMTKLDNESATSFRELAEAMKHSSASAQGVGLTFDQTAGYIATVSSISRRSASTIGEAFKTIFSRFEAVKGGKTFDPDNEPVNNVERDMNKVGIAIRKNSGEFKKFNDVLTEVHGKWKDLDDVQQNAIIGSLAGTRQREHLLILLNNWETYEELLKKEKESEGNAQDVFDKGFGTSTQAKINDLKNALQEFWMTLLDSKAINSFVGGVTTIVKGLTQFVKSVGDSRVAVVGITLAIIGVTKAITSLFNLFAMGTTLKKLTSIIGGAKTAEEIAVVGGALGGATKSVGLFANIVSKLPLLFHPVTLGIVAVTASVWGLSKAFKELKKPDAIKMKELETPESIKEKQIRKVSSYDDIKAGVPKQNTQPELTVSVDTKKAMDAYNKLEQQSRQKLLSIKANNTIITQQMATEMDSTYEKMGGQIKQNLQKQYNDNTSELNKFVQNTKSLTNQEKSDILCSEANYVNQKKSIIDKGLKEISDIYNTASANHRSLTDEELAQINAIQLTFLGEQVKAVSKNQIEQEAIYQNLKDNHTALTQQEASNVITESANARDKTIKDAEEKYLSIKAQAEYERDVTGTLSAEKAQKIIQNAEFEKKETIDKAKEQHTQVVEEVSRQCGDVANTIDLNSGKIFSAWDRIKKWFFDNPLKPTVEMPNLDGSMNNGGYEPPNGGTKSTPLGGHSAEALGGTTTKGDNLVGEEGAEILISKDKRRYAVVGRNGAEVVNMKGGETVIPHKETAKILSNKKDARFGDAYADGTDYYPKGERKQTTESGGVIEGEGFFPNLFGEKPSAKEKSGSKEKSSKSGGTSSKTSKTTNPNHFDFQSTVDVDKTQLDADIRDIDNLTKAITNLEKLTKVYKESKNFDEALKLNGMSIDTLNKKMNSLKIGYQNTLNTKELIGSKLLTEFTSVFKDKDLDSMTKPEFEAIYNQMYGHEQTGLSEEQKKTLQNQAKAYKQLTDNWFKAKEQLESLSQQQLDNQTAITNTIKEKWDIIFEQQDYGYNKINNTTKTLRDGLEILDKVSTEKFDEKIVLLKEIIKSGNQTNEVLKSSIDLFKKQRESYAENSVEYGILTDRIEKDTERLRQNQIKMIEDNQRYIDIVKKRTFKLIEKQVYGGKTQQQFEDEKKAKINALDDELERLSKQNDELKEQEERKKNLLDLTETQIDLEKTQKNKNVKQLTKDGNGNWQWTYVADEKAVNELEKQAREKMQNFAKWESETELKHKQDKIEKEKQGLQNEINVRREALESMKHNIEVALEDQEGLFANGGATINKIVDESLKNLNNTYNGKFSDILSNVRNNVNAINTELSQLNSDFISGQNGINDSADKGLPQKTPQMDRTVWVTDLNSPDGKTAMKYYQKLGYSVRQVNKDNAYMPKSDDILLGLAGTLYGHQSNARTLIGENSKETETKAREDSEKILQWQKTNLENAQKYEKNLNKLQSQSHDESTNNLNLTLRQQQGMLINSGNTNTSIVSKGWDSVHDATEQKLDRLLKTIRDKVSEGSRIISDFYDKIPNEAPSMGGGSSSSGSSGGSSGSSSGGGVNWGGIIGGIASGIGGLFGFDTGGFTGEWDDKQGRIALLHQKELVLNQNDTANILKTVDIQRSFMSMNNNVKMPNATMLRDKTSPQGIHIENLELKLPNVKDGNDVVDALKNLPNTVLQYSKLRY